ncbi:hypothetical protein STENM223S_00019 [Streptomyces tendae]
MPPAARPLLVPAANHCTSVVGDAGARVVSPHLLTEAGVS